MSENSKMVRTYLQNPPISCQYKPGLCYLDHIQTCLPGHASPL
jgi:hypothetical protein